jgi:predicted NBD/HSP70 family sugar kinase
MLTGGIRHDEMRRQNRSLVISAVRRVGKPSRTEIAKLTGLSQSTISAIAADLIAEGIMLEAEHDTNMAPPRRGRPQVALSLNPKAANVVCLHLSFNRLGATLIDYSGSMVRTAQRELNTMALSRQEMIDVTIDAVREINGNLGDLCKRIVVAFQGVTDAAGHEILWSPILSQTHIPLGQLLSEAFNVPVTIHNDGNLIATALHWQEPRRYGKNFVAVLLSHGIGMGLMLDGRIFTGIQSSGGEFGHMTHKPHGSLCRCGRRGCIEAYAGSYAIQRRARGEATDHEPPTDTHGADIESLLREAREHGGLAGQAFQEAGEAIGFGLGSLFSLIDPAPVALIGHGTAAFDLMEPEIRRALEQTAATPYAREIEFETWPDELPLIQQGCAMEALSSVDKDLSGPGARAGSTGESALFPFAPA